MIYLDYQATTPLAPEAFEAMVPLLRDQFANPHSAHRPGRAAAAPGRSSHYAGQNQSGAAQA